MEKDAKEALQVTKEIVVKFIEHNRLTPANFGDLFPEVYRVVYQTITRPTEQHPDKAAPRPFSSEPE